MGDNYLHFPLNVAFFYLLSVNNPYMDPMGYNPFYPFTSQVPGHPYVTTCGDQSQSPNGRISLEIKRKYHRFKNPLLNRLKNWRTVAIASYV